MNDYFSQLPPDLAEEAIAAERKKAIAMMLMKQFAGGVPPQPQGRILGKTSPLAMLANVGAQGLTQYQMGEADSQLSGIRRRGEEGLQQGISSISGAADPTSAIAQALASNDPRVRAYAQAARKTQQELAEKQRVDKLERDKLAETARGHTLEQVRAAAKAAADDGNTQVAQQILATGEIPAQYQSPARKPAEIGTVPGPDGTPMPSVTNFDIRGVPTTTVKAPGVTVNTGNTQQEKAADMAFGKESPGVLKEIKTSAQKAIQGLQASEQILNVLKNPAIVSGSFAEPRLFLAKVGETLGLRGPEGIAQTQKLISALANQTLEQVKRLTGAITEKERPFLAQAAAGEIDYSPETIRHLAEIAQVASHNELMDLYAQYNNTAALPGVGPNASMFPFPKGWRFQPNPETMEPQGPDSDRWRIKESASSGLPAAAPTGDPYKGKSELELQKMLDDLRRRGKK